MDHFDPETRELLQGFVAQGRTSSTTFARIVAYHTKLFQGLVQSVASREFGGLLGPRLRELVRLRSAQIGGCDECTRARYSNEVREDEIACMVVGTDQNLDPRERLALRYVTLMHTDHHRIDRAFYIELKRLFTTAEIVELGMLTATLLGQHRLLHTLDILGDEAPAISFDKAEIDAEHRQAVAA